MGLTNLELQENFITRIARNTFAACKELSELNLARNSIVYDGQAAADGSRRNRFLASQNFEAMTKLNLSHNVISVLDENLQTTFLNLVSLDISHNSFNTFFYEDFTFIKVGHLPGRLFSHETSQCCTVLLGEGFSLAI